MHSSMKSLTTLVLAAALAGCGGDAPKAAQTTTTNTAVATSRGNQDIGPVIATVSGIPIGEKEFQLAAQRVTPAHGETLSAEEKQQVLQELVDEKLLYAEARSRHIDEDPKVQKVMINTLLREDVYSGVRNADFTDEELKAYFDSHSDEFVVPAKVQIKRIFIKTTAQRPADQARAFAEELRAKIVAKPELFRELAAEHSDDPYRRRGGDLGYVSAEGKSGLDPKVVEVAFGLQKDAISDVFEAGGGFNIVQTFDRRERVERTFDQMKGSVLRKVKAERYKQMYDDYVKKVRGQHEVQIDQTKLDAVEVTPSRRLMLGSAPLGAGALLDPNTEDEDAE